MSIVVEVKALSKRYGSLAAVDGVSFNVKEGEIFGILGPNGAGKTTTVEIIEGLRKPGNGEASVCGIDALREPEQIKELIGVQFQTTSLYDQLRVKEVIDLFGGYYRKTIPTTTLLEEVALAGKKDKDYHDVIRENSLNGWRLVQVSAPGAGGLWAKASFCEVIFERQLES